jgi:hypothetical protein
VDGTLAQYIAVALHGSAWLADPSGAEPPSLDQTNSTFKYVAGAIFEDGSSRLDVAAWLVQLRAAGVVQIGLATPEFTLIPGNGSLPWHVRGSFLGGIPLGLIVPSQRGTYLWRARWAAAQPGSAKAWQVRYQCEPVRADLAHPPIEPTHAALVAALGLATDFAGAQGATSLSQTLDRARGLGFADHPEPAYHPDMVPPYGVSLPRLRLLAMACAAPVFGGMGSWNDMTFADERSQRAYDGISRQLFTAVIAAFLAAVNTR